jgi:serine/threonine protein kinase
VTVTVIANRYRLERLAGRGGMGEVWKAIDVATGVPVALKRMLGGDAGAERFMRESVLLAKVHHDALVAHVAHGVDAGIPWLAMAWIDGETLASRLAREGLSLGETLALARRIAQALSALHVQGIVHRDLKPSNVMLAQGCPDRAFLLDLGVARSSVGTRVLTATNLIVGTVGYMAPEQALSGRDVTASADVFSLGCLLFECLTGGPVYAAEDAIAILAHLLSQTPRRVRALRPEVPDALDSLVASMLERDTDVRPRDGAAVLAALDGARRRGRGPAADRATCPRDVDTRRAGPRNRRGGRPGRRR